MDGWPAFAGLRLEERKLIINEAEAATVRHIFRRYLELGSVRALQAELDATGIVGKSRTASDGSQYGTRKFSRGALYLMLQNRIYRGEIVHKGKAFPGEHTAIIDEDPWLRVQRHLEDNRVERRNGAKAVEPSLLAGIVFDAHAEPMTPTHTVKKGTRYRYYISRNLITGTVADKNRGQRIRGANLEALVIKRMRSLFADPVQILNALTIEHLDAPARNRLRDAAAALSARWDSEPTESLDNLLRSISVRAQVHANRSDLEIDPTRFAKCLMDGGCDSNGLRSHDLGDASEGPIATLTIPAQLKRAGMEMKFVGDGASIPGPADTSLIRLFVRAQKIGKRLLQPGNPPLEEMANEENVGASYATRLVRLTFLVPDIVAAILAGKQPADLTANKLMADTRLPLDWRDQRTALGFA